MQMVETGSGDRRSSDVGNSVFADFVLRPAPRGTTIMMCGFIGNPNGIEPSAWHGRPYDPVTMAAEIDGWQRLNGYFCVAAIKRGEDGVFRRRKENFARLLVLVGDDVAIEDLVGSPSYVLYTSPGKTQVGVFLDAVDPDCADPVLVSALMKRMADQGLVQLDRAGNNIVRYVRLVVGTNGKPRAEGPFEHYLHSWSERVRLTLEDAASVFGIDLDEVKRELAEAPRDASGAVAVGPVEFQDQKIRRLAHSILMGEELHDSTRDFVASLVASGTHGGTVTTLTQALMELSQAQRTRAQEWKARYADLGRLTRDAERKYRPRPGEPAAVIDIETGEIKPAQLKPMFSAIGELLSQIKAAEYTVADFLERNAISLHYGASGIGKSFLQVGWICSVATGTDWYGVKVKQGPVFVVIGEGYNGFVKRLKAWSIRTGVSLADAPIYISRRPAQLIDAANALEVTAEIEAMAERHGVRPELVVIDTLARNLGDGDENTAKDIGLFIANIDLHIRSRFECHVAIVHHSGHDQDRARGSSALRAAVDQEFWVQGSAGRLSLTCTKMKDGEPPAVRSFRIESVPLGDDSRGEPMVSAVLEIDGDPLGFTVVTSKAGKTVSALTLALELMRSGWPGFVALAAKLGVGMRNLKDALAAHAEGSKPLLVRDGRDYVLSDWVLDELHNSGRAAVAAIEDGVPRAPRTTTEE